MNENNETENLNSKRILLAGASVFLIIPVFLFLLEKIVGDSDDLSNPKLLIGVFAGGTALIDFLFVKFIKRNEKQNT